MWAWCPPAQRLRSTGRTTLRHSWPWLGAFCTPCTTKTRPQTRRGRRRLQHPWPGGWAAPPTGDLAVHFFLGAPLARSVRFLVPVILTGTSYSHSCENNWYQPSKRSLSLPGGCENNWYQGRLSNIRVRSVLGSNRGDSSYCVHLGTAVYVSAYVATTQAEQLSARTFQRSIPCRPASKAHTMEAHRACDAVHWRVAPTGHARAARKKRTRLSKMAKNGIFGHSTDNFSASRPSTPLFYWRIEVLR